MPSLVWISRRVWVYMESCHTGKIVCGMNLVRGIQSCSKYIKDCTLINVPLPSFSACINSEMRFWVFQELPNAFHVCVNYWFPFHAFRCLHVTWGLCLRSCPDFFKFWPGIESFKLISKFGVLDRYSNLLARVLKVLMVLCVQFIWSAVAQR